MCVRPALRVEQISYYWKAIYEIWYLNIFRKFIEKIQVSYKSDKKKTRTLSGDQYTFLIMNR